MRAIQPARELDAARVNMYIGRNPDFFVELSEYRYLIQLHDAADRIFSSSEPVKIVLLAGPSASGKTTTAQKLSEELAACGREVCMVSMDDFFLGLENMPRHSDGSYDMESVENLDVPLVKNCLKELLERGESLFPYFDFVNQRRSAKPHQIKLGAGGILIMEGIHALNPIFIEGLLPAGIVRIYVGVDSAFVLEGECIFSPSDIRLARRMVRDELFRGWEAEKTLRQWGSVCAGEALYIEPYRALAEFSINSAHDYEPAVLHNFLFPLLEGIRGDSPYYDYSKSFMTRFAYFSPLSPEHIPSSSLLREFVG